MSAPLIHPVILQPPHPNMSKEERDFYEKTMWDRSGGLRSNSPDLKGLVASVPELNTLVGITTTDGSTVQKQLNGKAAIADLGTIASQDADNVAITGGSITDTAITSHSIQIQAGTTVDYLNVGGTLNVDTTTKGNTAGVETDLITSTVDANTLSQNGSYLEVTAFGTIATNANLKEVKLILGSTTLLATGSLGANAGTWCIKAKIIRTGSTAEKCINTIVSDNVLIIDEAKYVAATEDLTTDLVIKCTGNGVAGNDVVQEGLIIEWYKL